MGSRLRPITDEKPKDLVEVGRKPIISYIIDGLYSEGIEDIVLCIGYKATKMIEYCERLYPNLNITYVENNKFYVTNNMYSLYLAREHLDEDILLMNGDVIFDSSIIKGLVMENTSSIAIDKNVYFEESMKIIVEDDYIRGISKNLSAEDSYGCSIDVYKILKEDLDLLKREMHNIIIKQKEFNKWTEVMLDNLFKRKELIAKPYDIKDAKWIEIDDYENLCKAEVLFSS